MTKHEHKWELAWYTVTEKEYDALGRWRYARPQATFVCTNQPCGKRKVVSYD